MPKPSLKRAPAKLKIGLVLDDTLDTPDGVQQYVLAVGRWLSAQGHDVHYLVGQTARTDIANTHSLSRNIKVRFNGNRMSMPLPSSMRRLRAFLRAEQFDVLHIQMPYSPLLAGRIIRAASLATAVVGTFHVAPQSRLVHEANRALGVLTRRSLKRFDRVASVSPVAQTFARKTYGLESQVIPNALDLQPFFKARPFPEYDNVKTIVFVGRLVERKGCQYLLRAVRRMVMEADEPFRVIVCGRGPLEETLREYVKTNHLEEIVTFAGWVSEADKPRYVASADIAIYPSTGGESFGIVLLEGMAAARGITLAGDNPGYRAVLADHPEVLFDPNDEMGLAALLASYLHDEDARSKTQAWQRSFAKQFDISVVGPELAAMYVLALQARRS